MTDEPQSAAELPVDLNEVVAEHYHQFENLPVCICVVETRGGFLSVGYSAVARHKFDAAIAQSFARVSALQNLRRMLMKWQ